MPTYHLILRNDDGSTVIERSLGDADLAKAWSTVGEIARQVAETQAGRILVKDDSGEVVILVGIASARVLAAKSRAACAS